MSNLDDKIKFSLFTPKGDRKLTTDYPELIDNKDIVGLSKYEMLFCYFLGCETSPLIDYYTSDEEKFVKVAVSKAIEHSGLRINDNQEFSYINERIFPAELSKGIKAFNKYKMSIRLRARMMNEKLLNNLEKIIDVDVNGEEFKVLDKEGQSTGEKDYDKIKKYADASLKISNELPEIINKIEYGYGIKESKGSKKQSEGDISFTDQKHEGNI